MTLLVKIHKRNNQTIVAVCDSDLIGQLFEEGDRQLDLRSDFYKGEERERVEIGDIIRNADVINLVGERAVKLAVDEELIDPGQIIRVANIPHAQVILLHN